MATEMNDKLLQKLVTLVKKNPGNSESFYVEQSGIERGQILRYLVKAELLADPSLKIPATGKAIVKARAEGVRWPRIAARTGLPESQVKQLFENESGVNARDSYTGRGRDFSGTKPATKSGSSGRRGKAPTAANTGTSGRRGKVGVKVTAGRRGAAAAAGKPAAKPAGRRTTRSGAKSDPR